ncbi:hypothetical protein E6C50_13240 [Flavobacterium supellecticarium]|uniref:Uncharacterized protein n=1 Tax=Flavobacterium supellecticarium TaxID=2565924 RepID=A0A4S3ZU89_9FLAO|nr:hypothetical protein [Flavobacterium supellecticarium]THF49200.1 hypothetical protein E6C50_13240 [Flavobacterium supellecticarium]
MIKQIRNSKFTKVVAWYLALMMFVEITQPIHMYALTSGPSQPEFNSFTPIGTSDMVDLASGDFNYNIPIMDVGGYPLNLSYNAGITTDQEASWVGLGWNLNVGQIERQVRGLPDDFRGDVMQYENDLRENITVGTYFGFNAAFAGYDAFKPGVGLGVQYNNYEGITFKPSFGLSFQLSENVAVGLNFTGSATEGASVNPTVSISAKLKEKFDSNTTSESLKGTGTIGLGFSSRKGVENLNLSASVKRMSNLYSKTEKGETQVTSKTKAAGALGGSVSFNDMSYTPSKRVGFENTSFTFNGAFGSEFFLTEFQGQISGYGSYQKVASQYRNRKEKAFGYENTEYKRAQAGVLDFNRENERTVTENTTALPVTNYTYDIYNIDGQGVSGMFRPYRSQVSYLYNDKVTDYGEGASLGVEFGIGNIAHTGVDFKVAPSTSTTGGWVNNNNVLQYFKESSTDTKKMEYEPVTYKLVGSTVVDPEQSIYLDKIHKEKALRIGLDGGTKNRMTTNRYYEGYNGVSHVIDSKIKRTKRYLRNQLVHKVTAEETAGDPFVIKNDSAKVHHTAGIKVLQTDGSTYVYGRTAYNMRKVEATFDVSGQTGNNTNGLVPYNGTTSGNNTSRSDKFLNKITTPPYAHSYLITSVLSADYEDVDGNGPSLNDLGTFTKFDYKTVNNYKWRIPFQANMATYNEGLISHKDDQKGTYLYGIKELTYLDKISTKTHVAFFDLEDRLDAVGVAGEQGGAGTERMKRIKSIRLYSRPEVTNASGDIFDPGINSAIKPIKTAHFDYDYSLCKNTPNSLAPAKGKLTLKRVFFTYRDSNMGRYTPYVFHYGLEKSKNKPDNYTITNDAVNNPDYDPKGFDIWGNYKVNPAGSGNLNSALSNTEYPFVDQGNQQIADNNTGAWTLKSVQLPSGGVIAIETESDDYQYVQNKRAMQMFKVAGAGSTKNPGSGDITNTLYNEIGHNKYLYIKLDDASGINTREDFVHNYLRENLDKAIQFRFLMNMTANASQYEYVSGYFEIGETDTQKINVVNINNYGKVVAIPLKLLNRDGSGGPENVNPIAKTGWGFGRTYLNRIVYSIGGDNSNTNFVSIVNDLLGSIESISRIFDGPNRELERKGCARIFKTDKSWIRLENSKGRKLGGGLRVKSIRLSDEWGSMLSSTQSGGTDLSSMEYGQTYSYDDDGDSKGNNKKSSGVATYEPNGSAENALLEPLYPNSGSYAQNISAPRENNYVEKPFGENFFPAPRVTYSKVTVQNLPRKEGNKEVKRHATGKVVTRHYTSYDFPTKVDFTDPDVKSDIPSPNQLMGFVTQLVSFMVRSHLTMSQGYSVETNDMNGKVKSQEVYAEGNTQPISKVEYKYNVDANGNLDNYLQTINKNGEVKRQLLGVDYDMINDFNESRSESELAGFDGNLGAFIFTLFPGFVPTILPKYSYNENLLRTAVTTKHVHKTGILVEKIAYDLGSSVSTKNLAWDASSGEVILTQTTNEYNDQYYAFTYPAYWKYDGMGLASTNIGIEGALKIHPNLTATVVGGSSAPTDKPYFWLGAFEDVTKYFHLGDELYLKNATTLEPVEGEMQALAAVPSTPLFVNRLWVVGFASNNGSTGILLMDKDGNYFNKCSAYSSIPFKIMRSGYRNLQAASMASITLMKNPITITDAGNQIGFLDQSVLQYDGTSGTNPRILNASAVVYNDYWKPQSEHNLPYYPDPATSGAVDGQGNPNYPYAVRVNPYLWNIKGDWRAQESYAYLTSRNAATTSVNNPRNEGFFAKFVPFYIYANGLWTANTTNWKSASSITLYSPYGTELENKDALNRYSAAQYGYNYTLPMAVASNSKYSEMGFDGFEETRRTSSVNPPHFSFNGTNTNYSTNHSHTGKRSIKVATGQSVKLVREMITAPASVRQETCPPPPSTDPANCAYTFEIVGSEGSCSGETIRRVKLTFPAAITATDIIASYIGPNSDPIDITNITVDPNNNRIVYICVSGSFPSGLPVPGQTPPSNSLGSYKELTVSMGNTTCCVRLYCHNSGGSTYTIAADTCTNF